MLFGLGMSSWAIVALGSRCWYWRSRWSWSPSSRRRARLGRPGPPRHSRLRTAGLRPRTAAASCRSGHRRAGPAAPVLEGREPAGAGRQVAAPGQTLPITGGHGRPATRPGPLGRRAHPRGDGGRRRRSGPPESVDTDPLDDLLIKHGRPAVGPPRPATTTPRPAPATRRATGPTWRGDPHGARGTAARDDADGGGEPRPVVVRQQPGGPVVLEGTWSTPPSAGGRCPAAPGRAPRSHAARPMERPTATDVPARSEGALPRRPPATWPAEPRPVGAARPPSRTGRRCWRGRRRAATAGGRPRPAGRHHVLVTDLDRSLAFYRDMLGFLEIDGGEGNAVLASGRTRLVLRDRSATSRRSTAGWCTSTSRSTTSRRSTRS